jgi:hypothetical protein
MTLQEFQRALGALIASPELCLSFISNPGHIFDYYDLSPREQQRLKSVVLQHGMSTNCSLYRTNRITPIYTLLPKTCFMLGAELVPQIERFWECNQDTDMQFGREMHRFAGFIIEQIRLGQIENRGLEEIINFELAVNDLRFLPRHQIVRELQHVRQKHEPTRPRLNPLMRVVVFRHEPVNLLRQLTALHPPPYNLIEGEFHLLLDSSGDELDVKQIDSRLGNLLQSSKSVRTHCAIFI